MASLKEIRGRIHSISTTLKITDVTRMIASAKLHKARMILGNFLPYQTKIKEIFFNLLHSGELSDTPFADQRKQNKIVIVAISSNGSLCGAFNMNAIKKTAEMLESYSSVPPENITLYAIGKKMYDAFARQKGITLKGPYSELLDSCTYENVEPLANELIKLFLKKEVDVVEVIHNKFKNILTQYITLNTLLPMEVAPVQKVDLKEKQEQFDYIVEPSRIQIMDFLAPQVIRLSLFGMILESAVSEYAARSTAMQTATDNANELIEDLTKQYNRLRQAVITKEIIDIVGGAEALR